MVFTPVPVPGSINQSELQLGLHSQEKAVTGVVPTNMYHLGTTMYTLVTNMHHHITKMDTLVVNP